MKSFIKRLLCQHEWIETGNQLVDAGRNKMFWIRCEKCGKTSVTMLDGRKKFKRSHNCNTCVKHGVIGCPNSSLCYSTTDNPYWDGGNA